MINNYLTSHDIRLKRILYRSLHRGCKETDIVLGNFAKEHLHTLSLQELNQFEALLDEQDWDIWEAVTKPNSGILPEYQQLLAKIINPTA